MIIKIPYGKLKFDNSFEMMTTTENFYTVVVWTIKYLMKL